MIALIVVGPGTLPDVGAALGKSIREFRKASSDISERPGSTRRRPSLRSPRRRPRRRRRRRRRRRATAGPGSDARAVGPAPTSTTVPAPIAAPPDPAADDAPDRES